MMDRKFRTLVLCILFCLFQEAEETAARTVQNPFKKCLKCPPGWGVVQICTKKVNTVCHRCRSGKTYSPQHSFKSPCWLCSKCGIGLYEAQGCTPVRDTICNECSSYIDHKNFTKLNDFRQKCSYLFLHR